LKSEFCVVVVSFREKKRRTEIKTAQGQSTRSRIRGCICVCFVWERKERGTYTYHDFE